MSDVTEKLNRLLELARQVHYQGPLPRELSIGDLQDFTRLHAEILGLATAGLELEGVKRAREARLQQARRDARYRERLFDDLRHAEELGEVLRAERDEAREAARRFLAEAWGDNPRALGPRVQQYPWLEEPPL